MITGGYVYVCLPWVSKSQWHPFSLYESQILEGEVCVFIHKNGDWTENVHRALQRNTSRPLWFCGPFTSPSTSADMYDHHIFVASGIGITPALSIMQSLMDTRRVNLIWMVRDTDMVKFYLPMLNLNEDGWVLIFYTGKKSLDFDVNDYNKRGLKIMRGRPNLKRVILNIIYGSESGGGLPSSKFHRSGSMSTNGILLNRRESLSTQISISTPSIVQVDNSTVKRSTLTLGSIEDEDDCSDFHSCCSRLCDIEQETIPQREKIIDPNENNGHVVEEFVESLAENEKKSKGTNLLETWDMLYCGASKEIEHILKEISGHYNIDFNIENHNW